MPGGGGGLCGNGICTGGGGGQNCGPMGWWCLPPLSIMKGAGTGIGNMCTNSGESGLPNDCGPDGGYVPSPADISTGAGSCPTVPKV